MSSAATSSASASGDQTSSATHHASWFTQARTTAAALIAVAAAAVSLLFQIVPALKPDPRDHVGADVSVFALERNVTIGDWINRAFPASKRAALIDRYPDRTATGELLYVRTVVDGHKHHKVTLHFSVLSTKTQELVPPAEIDAPAIDPVKLSAPNERSVHAVWVPDLSNEPDGLYFRIELWDERGILAVADSPPLNHGRFSRSPSTRG